MGKDLSETLAALARAQDREARGMGSFLATLDRLEQIERQLDDAVRESLKPFDAFCDRLPALMRRQAD